MRFPSKNWMFGHDDLCNTRHGSGDTSAGDRRHYTEKQDCHADKFKLMEEGKIHYIIYTGALYDATMGDYMVLHRRALQLSIACLTSLDTANALADIIASRFNEENTELVDINHMRSQRSTYAFAKMESAGDDYIFFDNRDGGITCPESLCVSLCSRHYGIGGDGIVLIEESSAADAKMRIFNMDGSEGRMAGNAHPLRGKISF